MKTDFKVYKRKIHVYNGVKGAWSYAYSTNAFKTCKAAVLAHKTALGIPLDAYVVKASFAKD